MPLYEAARNGHLAIAQMLLKTDADVKVRYSDNQMPLHWTTKYEYLGIIKELFVSGANRSTNHSANRSANRSAKTKMAKHY
jgi:ankyrin repeat protein